MKDDKEELRFKISQVELSVQLALIVRKNKHFYIKPIKLYSLEVLCDDITVLVFLLCFGLHQNAYSSV